MIICDSLNLKGKIVKNVLRSGSKRHHGKFSLIINASEMRIYYLILQDTWLATFSSRQRCQHSKTVLDKITK